MDSSGSEPLSGLRSLVARVLGATDHTSGNKEAPPAEGNGKTSEFSENMGQNWLSHFAAVAPDHIKRWTNPADGTGNIPYEQLVENLQQFNIPARHASEYTLAQLLGVEPPPQDPPQEEESFSPPTPIPVRSVTPRPHKLGPQAAAYLARKQSPTFTQVIPVREVTKAFVGPVKQKVGSLSGEPCKLLKRPAETSEVPPDYVEVVGSKHVRPIGSNVNTVSRETSNYSGVESIVCPTRTEATRRRPSPIYLEPVVDPSRGVSGAHKESSSEVGRTAAAKFLASIPKRAPGTVDIKHIHTKEDKEVYDAINKPVIYTMGKYVWSKEQADKGDEHSADIPLADACFDKLCKDMFFQEEPSSTTTQDLEAEPPKSLAKNENSTLFLPKILELCKESRKELAAFAEEVVETRDDPDVGGKGLFSTVELKKGQVVFVEMPLLTCEIESDSMWTTFTSLNDEQKAVLETLQGFDSDLSKDESLWCILLARANKRIDLAKPFKSFLAKMKRNAHGMPSEGRWGLYPKAAKVNHSCEPNVTYRNLEGLLVYFATRDISRGEKLTMSYIDQLYTSAAFRNKRLLHTKCFTCNCTRCGSMKEKERRILCPSCRPTKLKIVDSGADVPTAPPPSDVAAEDTKKREDSCEEKEPQGDRKFSPVEPGTTDGEDTSAQASDDESKPIIQSSDDESKPIMQSSDDEMGRSAASETAGEDDAALLDVGSSPSECRDEERSDFGEGFLASDEGTRGSNDFTDSASNSDRSPEEMSDCETKQKLFGSGKLSAHTSTSLMLSVYAMNSCASKSTELGQAESQSEDQSARSLSNAECSSTATAEYVAPIEPPPPPMYCQRNGNGIWICSSCSGRFTDDDMPIGMEDYFERLYVKLQSKFNFPTTPQWTVDVASLIKSIEVVLGTQHWLYAACNLLLAQLYLGQWVGGMVRDSIFDRSLKHAEVFIKFVETTTREALHVDCAPLVASLMRVLLFNGRWATFEHWVKIGRLEIVKDCLGSWDEAFLSFSEAYAYLQRCHEKGDLPQLSVLHRYAHTAQYTIIQAAEQLEKRESERKKALEKAAQEKERSRQAEEERLRALQERNRRMREHVELIKAQVAARAKIKDVTASHSEGVLAKFMLAGVDDCVINDAAMAVQRAHQYAKEMQEAAVQGRRLFPGSMAAEMAYMPPQGVMPSKYLPLIMLDDPLRAIPEKSKQVRQRRAQAAREKAILDARCAQQDLDFEEDESVCEEIASQPEDGIENIERTMIYRIPGLSGTAPGEFVNVSQLVHDEKGNHAPLPLFKSFFYIDSAERRRSLKADNQSSLIVLGSASSPPVLSEEKLEDIEAAKYNYLHEERQKFEKDVRDGVLLAATEAGALKDESKLVDVVETANKVIQNMVIQEARAERAIEEARYAVKGIEPPQRPAIETSTVVKVPQDQISTAKPQAHTTAGVSQKSETQEKQPLPVESATMPGVWEYVPSHNHEKGPTVFLYPPTSQPAPSSPGALPSIHARDEESKVYMGSRIIKPLDFSHIPPPPKVEDIVGAFGNTHQHYKMSRINMMKTRFGSPTKKVNNN